MTTKKFKITEREQEVLTLLAQGLSTTQMSATLFLSVHTIKAHFYSMFNKFEINEEIENQRKTKRLRLLIKAYKYGYVELERDTECHS